MPDLLATLAIALGIDAGKSHNSNLGRPIRIVDKLGTAVQSVLN